MGLVDNSENELAIWVIYDRPTDYPNNFVARLWLGSKPTITKMICSDLERIRQQLAADGKVKMARHPNDDPKIVETWI